MIAEDDPDLGDAIVRRLRRAGDAADWQSQGQSMDEILRYQKYDLAVLDIGLPRRVGFSILRALRARDDRTPVLMLTARSDIEDASARSMSARRPDRQAVRLAWTRAHPEWARIKAIKNKLRNSTSSTCSAPVALEPHRRRRGVRASRIS